MRICQEKGCMCVCLCDANDSAMQGPLTCDVHRTEGPVGFLQELRDGDPFDPGEEFAPFVSALDRVWLFTSETVSKPTHPKRRLCSPRR